MAADLQDRGWTVCPDYFPASLVAALHDDMRRRDAEGRLHAAGIGRGEAVLHDETIRNDRTLWLRGAEEAPREFLRMMEELRRALNRLLFLGLFEYEAHYALYPVGGFYKKHRDALRGARNRMVSTVAYLTPDWRAEEGGHLVLYDPHDEGREITRILPQAGTLALFLSEEMPHEVLPPARERASIAGWFRCNGSAGGRVDPGR